MKWMLAISIGLLIVFSANAQDSTTVLRDRYNKEAILLSFPYYYKNDVRLPLRKLKDDLFISPKAYIAFEQGYRRYRTGKVLTFTALAANIVSLATINSNRQLSTGLLIGTVVTNIVGMRISFGGKRLIEKAVFLRNRELLFPESKH
ncbi:MAG: hypothetical protein K2P88_02975 [Chitinophagaceae bacterium]|nr:hypothetical protein [Chitinophagaceae bacterium]